MALTVVWIVVAVLLALLGSGRFKRWFFDVPRLLVGRRAWLAAVAMLLGWCGCVFIGAWALVRYADGLHDAMAPQRAPSGLWGIGAVLVVVGSVGVALTLFTAPPRRPGDPIPQGRRNPLVAGLLIATDVPLVIASGVSTHSGLRGVPILFAPLYRCRGRVASSPP